MHHRFKHNAFVYYRNYNKVYEYGFVVFRGKSYYTIFNPFSNKTNVIHHKYVYTGITAVLENSPDDT